MWVLARSSYLTALIAGILDKEMKLVLTLKPQKYEMQSNSIALNEKAVAQEVAG